MSHFSRDSEGTLESFGVPFGRLSFRGSGSSSWSRRACVFLTFSRDSEGTLESFVLPFGRLFGTKLGGVLAFVVLLFWAGLG